MIEIRNFRPGDEPALFEVFRSAVHEIAAGDYDAEQCRAWAPLDLDPEVWAEKMRALRPFVAVLDEEIVGYADLQEDGLIDHVFVSGRHPRQGIGAALMTRILAEAEARGIPELHAHVSLTAQPFFARHGFQIELVKEVELRGMRFENALMRRRS